MSDATGHSTPTGRIIDLGEPLIKLEKNVETVAEVYPGRLVAKGTTDYDIKVADGVNAVPVGWALFEQTSPEWRKDAFTTIFAVNDKIKVGRGGDFSIYAWMPKGFVARQGDKMFSWSNGYVVPGQYVDGFPCIAVPYSKNVSEYDTGVDFATGMLVKNCFILSETNIAASTISVGILSSEGGGSATGFLVVQPVGAVAGLITQNLADATQASVYAGALITEVDLKDANSVYFGVLNWWKCDGTAKSLSYTTSSHVFDGRMLIQMGNIGITEVGTSEEAKDATAAEARVWVKNTF